MISRGNLQNVSSALIGAALGDALGWPHELRGGRVKEGSNSRQSHELIPWTRRSGGRFNLHDETRSWRIQR